jgi:PHD/YefM family antitoxin component YafN of YafNO toxin-antitoxin module
MRQATKLTVGQARDQFADTLNQGAYRGDRIVIERHGKDIAAFVPIEDLELLEALEDRIDLEKARASLKAAESEGTVSWEQVKEDLRL